MLGGSHVGLLLRMYARYVHRSRPALADEVELRDELVGPSGYDGLPGGVARGMVVEAALGATFRVAPRPYAHVHGKDGMSILAPGERKAGEQAPQGLGVVDSPPVQRGVEASPATTVGGLKAQVDGRGDGIGAEEGIAVSSKSASALRWRQP